MKAPRFGDESFGIGCGGGAGSGAWDEGGGGGTDAAASSVACSARLISDVASERICSMVRVFSTEPR